MKIVSIILLLITAVSCNTQRRCAKCINKYPIYIHDSTTVTVTDTVYTVQIQTDTARNAVYVPCKAIDTIIAVTHNARAKAWIADSIMHVEVSQGGDTPVTVQSRSRERYRYLYVQNECEPTKMYINVFAGIGFIAMLILLAYIIVHAIIRPNR